MKLLHEIRDLCLWAMLILLAVLSLASMTVVPVALMGLGVSAVFVGWALAWIFWRGVKFILCQLSS
jgi:hypothetical protein